MVLAHGLQRLLSQVLQKFGSWRELHAWDGLKRWWNLSGSVAKAKRYWYLIYIFLRHYGGMLNQKCGHSDKALSFKQFLKNEF